MTANNAVVGVRDREGNRLDVPSADGTQLPVVLRLGDGIVGAPEVVVEGEKQVLLVVPSKPISIGGNGLSGYVPVSKITLDGSVSVSSYDDVTQNATVYGTSSGGGVIPIGSLNTVYWSNGTTNSWTGDPIIHGVVYHPATGNNHATKVASEMVVDQPASGSGTIGSYAMSAAPYDQSVTQTPRNAKFFGSFSLAGTYQTKVLTFSSNINGVSMPPSSVLTGTFTFGWRGLRGSNPYNSGAVVFLVSIISDSSGVPMQFRTSVSGGNYATQSNAYTFTIDPSSLSTSMSIVDGIVPTAISIALSGSDFLIEFGTMNLVGATDSFKFYWEFSYGWGTT